MNKKKRKFRSIDKIDYMQYPKEGIYRVTKGTPKVKGDKYSVKYNDRLFRLFKDAKKYYLSLGNNIEKSFWDESTTTGIVIAANIY